MAAHKRHRLHGWNGVGWVGSAWLSLAWLGLLAAALLLLLPVRRGRGRNRAGCFEPVREVAVAGWLLTLSRQEMGLAIALWVCLRMILISIKKSGIPVYSIEEYQ